MLLFRKIDETRWFEKGPLESLSVTELNTKDNELSVWMDFKKVYDMDLALAFTLTQKCFQNIWCVKIPDEELTKRGLKLRQENSKTCYESIRPFHTNIVVPTIRELGELASLIHELVQDPHKNCRYFSVTDLKIHYYRMVKSDLITINYNERDNKGKWDTLMEVQKKLGKIDFSKLKNVKPLEAKKK